MFEAMFRFRVRLFFILIIASIFIIPPSETILAQQYAQESLEQPAQGSEGDVPVPDAQLPTVLVTSDRDDGSAEAGYAVKNVENFGPWGDKAVLDTPYTVFPVKAFFIDNIQARNPGDIVKRTPNVFGGWAADSNQMTNMLSRGLWMTSRSFINGVQTDNVGLGMFIEDVDSMEILSGLSGFMYGQGNVGGLINYNLKRPTFDFYNKAKVGNYGGQQYYGHLDLGGPIVKDKLAFRLNIMGQDGKTSVQRQHIGKQFFSGALDWNITEDFQMQVNASYGEVHMRGRQGAFVPTDTTIIHRPPNPSKLWVSDDTGNDVRTKTYGWSAKYKITDWLKFRAAYSHRDSNRRSIITGSSFVNGTDNYTYYANHLDWKYRSNGANAYFDAGFNTFGIEHKITAGVNGYMVDVIPGRFRNAAGTGYSQTFQVTGFGGNFNKNSAVNDDIRGLDIFNRYFDKRVKTGETFNYNIIIGDEIKFNDQWQLMVGLNYATLNTKSYNISTERLTSKYDKSRLTPTVSLLYKPIPQVTTYFTYVEALENGSIVGSTYVNAGEILPPLMSEQYEVGVKAEVNGMMLTAALFQIDKGLQFADAGTNKYVQDGRQRHRGLELTARGKLFESLTLVGGFTLIDAEIKKTANKNVIGNRPTYIPEHTAKLYAEYALPFLDGLTLTGGVYYHGSTKANQLNTVNIASHVVADLGLRYAADIMGLNTTFRLNVTNITDKAYWVGETGSEIILGDPRSIAFTAEFSF